MNVLELRYIRRIRISLGLVGAWPTHVLLEDCPSKKWTLISRYGYTSLMFILCSIGMVAQAVYLVRNKGKIEFIYLGQTCLTLLMSCVFCVSDSFSSVSLPIRHHRYHHHQYHHYHYHHHHHQPLELHATG